MTGQLGAKWMVVGLVALASTFCSEPPEEGDVWTSGGPDTTDAIEIGDGSEVSDTSVTDGRGTSDARTDGGDTDTEVDRLKWVRYRRRKESGLTYRDIAVSDPGTSFVGGSVRFLGLVDSFSAGGQLRWSKLVVTPASDEIVEVAVVSGGIVGLVRRSFPRSMKPTQFHLARFTDKGTMAKEKRLFSNTEVRVRSIVRVGGDVVVVGTLGKHQFGPQTTGKRDAFLARYDATDLGRNWVRVYPGPAANFGVDLDWVKADGRLYWISGRVRSSGDRQQILRRSAPDGSPVGKDALPTEARVVTVDVRSSGAIWMLDTRGADDPTRLRYRPEFQQKGWVAKARPYKGVEVRTVALAENDGIWVAAQEGGVRDNRAVLFRIDSGGNRRVVWKGHENTEVEGYTSARVLETAPNGDLFMAGKTTRRLRSEDSNVGVSGFVARFRK